MTPKPQCSLCPPPSLTMFTPPRPSSYHVPRSPPASLSRRQTAPIPAPSAQHRPTHLLVPATQSSVHPLSLGIPLRFHLVHHSLEIHGYQMYAVEKWIVERNRSIPVLVVYTGDPSHKISVFSLSPSQDLTPPEAQAEWAKVFHHLQRDGARPKETPQGVLMATSLAHFRSDYTIVHIPDGNFLAVREQLYTNINLLRMGCSGRSALTLEDPSDATKSRFISTYHFPESISSATGYVTSSENLALPPALTKSRSHSHSASVLSFTTPSESTSKGKNIGLGLPSTLGPDSQPLSTSPSTGKTTKDNSVFIATVLELVKFIQAGLAIFGMYGVALGSHDLRPYLDGLLCDETVEGIRRWIVEVGEPCVGIEPMERIADPMFVAALLSLILCVRNKLAALGFSHVVPKDPILHPDRFLSALTSYVQSTHPAYTNSAIPPPVFLSSTSRDPSFLSTQPPSTSTTPSHSHLGHSTHGFAFPPYLHHLVAPPASHTHTLPTPPQMTPSTSSSSYSTSHANAPPQAVVLTREFVDAIGAAYDAKARVADGRVGGHGGRMRKALRDKLRVGVESDGDGGNGGFERDRGAMSGGEGGGTGERGRESLGGVGTGVASSGGQILSGIGSFASGLGLGVGAGSGSGAAGAGALLEATNDMAWLAKSIYGKEGKGKTRKAIAMGMGKEKKGDTGDSLSVGYGYPGMEKEKDGGVGVSVRALWRGQVTSLLKLREWEIEKERMGASVSGPTTARKRERASVKERDRLALSDGDVDDTAATAAKLETEEESDVAVHGGGFGGIWGEKVQKRLESWTGRARKRGHMSLDLTTPASRGLGDKNNSPGRKYPLAVDPLSTARPDVPQGGSLPLSPTLPPMAFVAGDGDADDDDLLSSGQVSPIDNARMNPFHLLHDGRSLESTSLTNNTDYERKVTEFNQKRPWGGRIPQQNRVSSWADPVSVRDVLDEDGSDLEGRVGGTKPRRRKRGDTISSLLGRAGMLSEEPEEILDDSEGGEGQEDYLFPNRLLEMFGPTRRRSFHDLESLRGMRVLAIERMRVDVELSGQTLIMSRREKHLQNVLACLQVVTSSLSETNTLLREDYQSHIPFLSNLEAHTQVISVIDAENAKADKTSQATHTLRYEAEQFRIADLWHTATPPRQKVLELREKIFGTGGRRLPPGVHGAHGPFNRLQWTLDSRERLVDHLGRTESEAEEVKPGVPYLGTQEEDEEDVVDHPGIKPMWLLRFFTSWGARWGAPTAASAPGEDNAAKGTSDITPEANGKAIGNGDGAVARDDELITKLSFVQPSYIDDDSSVSLAS